MRGDLVLETRSGTIPMWIVVSRVSGVTLMLKTVAIHSGSVERQRGRGLIIVHHVVVALVAVVSLVDVVRLLVAEGVVRAGRGTGTGAALLVAKVHVISDDFPGRHNIATAFLATLLKTIKPVVNSIIARLWLRFTQLDIGIKSRFIGIQNILGLFLFVGSLGTEDHENNKNNDDDKDASASTRNGNDVVGVEKPRLSPELELGWGQA